MMSLTAFLPSPPSIVPQPPDRCVRFDSPVTAPIPADSIRQQIAAAASLAVVKVGTRVLTLPDGTLNYPRIEQLAEEIHAISAGGRRVVLVSSGAVGAGVSLLSLKSRPTDLAKLQAVAA